MRNLKISRKFALCFGIVIVLTLLLSMFAVYTTISMDNNFTHLLDYNVERVVTLKNVDAQFWMARRALSHMGVFSGLENAEGPINAQRAVIDKAVTDINEMLRHYIELIESDSYYTDAQKSVRLTIANRIVALTAIWHRDVVGPVTIANLEGNRQEVIDIAGRVADISNELFGAVDELIYFAGDSISDVGTAAGRSILILIVFSLIVAAISVCIALLFPKTITKPLIILSEFMKKAGTLGDISTTPEEEKALASFMHDGDEIGQLMTNCGALINHIINISNELDAVANGDLTVKLDILSDKDTLGQSILHTVDNLNDMFVEISATGSQVSSGSKQIADGAQTLAQGSTEQAATVQQLSSSVSEIAQKTKRNAEMAAQAASLATIIMQNAEKGNSQMGEMTAAVKEINQASQDISKIIKTIDDIAFQTNILALNAAVEAARAGQHGKGFAVVAEEVRNLASKSAEAAKDTGNMIQNSMEKAEFGVRIAQDTAASLSEIVSGISESTQLVKDIAMSSEEQSQGISQINSGIDQVAMVVQQNSATAQESAAASEEISGQSAVLEQLVSRFVLKDSGLTRSLPPAKRSE